MSPSNEPDTSLDAEQILRTLANHRVDYVLVGGLAVQVHGHVRTTFDVDVLPRPARANLAQLADALNELDARVLNPGSEDLPIDAAMLPRATLWQFETRHGAIDVIHDAPGAPAYDELRGRALEIDLGGLALAVAGRDDLISMKRASARPVDLDDLAALTEPQHRQRETEATAGEETTDAELRAQLIDRFPTGGGLDAGAAAEVRERGWTH